MTSEAARRKIAAVLVAAGLVLGVAARAGAATGNSLQVVMHADAGMKATLYIYGPNGYYKTASYGPFPRGSGLSRNFTGAPCCDYRLKVVWSNHKEHNMYGRIFSASSGQTRCRAFVSDAGYEGSC